MEFFIWMTAATLNLAIASVVLCVMISGKSAYRYVSLGGRLADAIENGSPLPRIGSAFVFVLYLGIALLCIGQAGAFEFPLSSKLLLIVTAYYLMRASVLLFDRFINPPLPTFVLMTSYAALLVGLWQAIGLVISVF